MAMAPPQGMATVRTSMAIAGGSGESFGFRDDSMSLSPSMEAKTDTTDCGLYGLSPVENCPA